MACAGKTKHGQQAGDISPACPAQKDESAAKGFWATAENQ